MPKFSAYKKTVSGHLSCFPFWNMPSSGFSVAYVQVVRSLAAVVAVSVLFYVVLALNWKIQSEACISAAKYMCSPFFWKPR